MRSLTLISHTAVAALVAVVAVAAVFLSAASAAAGDAYPVGLTAFRIADPNGLRPLQVDVLYPAEPGLFGGNRALEGFEAVADAPRAEGRFPLVLISHGLYGR